LRCDASLDVRKEYACAQPAPSEVEGSILARLAFGFFELLAGTVKLRNPLERA
jgi:hypothetical protein